MEEPGICPRDGGKHNPDIIPQRAAWNVHFKKPTASYTDLFSQLEAAGTISTHGLKPDATHYCELVFDVNSAYFDNHGGYEFAKQFYEDAYKAAVQIVGGEQYILSAVMGLENPTMALSGVRISWLILSLYCFRILFRSYATGSKYHC